MKKIRVLSLMLAFVVLLPSSFGCGGKKQYTLTEKTFFLVMTNIQYYPEQYLGSVIEYDAFTYKLTDVNGKEYVAAVRKCSSGYGCTCGNDTVIGFLLDYAGDIPEPRNQSADNNDKTWIHVVGSLKSAEKTSITVNAFKPDGTVDGDKTETISFLTFGASSVETIADYSRLAYYVTK